MAPLCNRFCTNRSDILKLSRQEAIVCGESARRREAWDTRAANHGKVGRCLIVDWLPEARRNRFDQLDYIAQDNPLAAADQDDEIERQVDMLTQHPKMGRPSRMNGTRKLRTPFVVVYRPQRGVSKSFA